MYLEQLFGLERRENIRLFLLALFAFCLPLHQKWSTLVLLALVAISLLMKKEKELFWNLPFLLPSILYFIIAVSLLYSEQSEFRYLEQRASLIAFPVIFASSRLSSIERTEVLKYFVWGCALALLICYGYAFYNSISVVHGSLTCKPVVNDEFSFMYAVVRDGNYFFSSHFSIFHQTTYFAIYLNTAIALILAFSFWKKNNIYFLFLAIFTLGIFQLSSKIGILICGLIFIIYGIFRITKIYYKILFIMGILFLGILFMLKNPRSKIMIETLVEKGVEIQPSERYGYSLRLMSWNASMNVIAENPVFGVGVGDTQSELNKVYAKNDYTQPLKENLNAHNQFLQTLLVSGLLGFSILIAIIWSLFEKCKTSNIRNYELFGILFLILIILSFLFESVLNRYSGISFFFFFYYLIVTQKENKFSIDGN